METVIVLSRKGGVGKTATAHALGAALMKRKKRVLFIDADGQSNLTLTMKGNEEHKNFYNVLLKECSIREAIQETEAGYIIPGNEMLQTVDTKLGSKDTLTLSKALKEISNDFDYCIIDTPAALGLITTSCIIAADKIIVPLQADIYSLQGIRRVVESVNAVNGIGFDKKISGFLLTRLKRTNLSKKLFDDLESIAKDLNTKVFNSKIRECNAIMEAAINQTDIFSFAPKSNAAVDYEAFVKEFLKAK